MSTASAFQASPIQRYLEQLEQALRAIDDGEVASYIPELTRADPDWLGIALVTVDGHVYQVGESRQPFTIQSVSKAITYGLALEDRGEGQVTARVGVEPSGEAFNSISLEEHSGRPMNPMINAGAIATTGLIDPGPALDPMARILDTFSRYTGHAHEIDDKVYASESATGHRNRAIAHLLYGHGIVDRDPEQVVDLYFRQCSILVNARDLAMMGACLANNGVNPVTGVVALQGRQVQKVLSVMSTCGMYDYSGSWIFNVGMPAKSGVGGGIMAVLPGQFGLGVFSPRLDPKGNSVRGIEACRRLSADFGLHLFNVARSTSASVVRKAHDCTRFGSRRRRGSDETAVLAAHGTRIRVYELQGELMFGSAESVATSMLSALSAVDFLVVDLRRVVALDEASIRLFEALVAQTVEGGRAVFFTDCEHLYALRRRLHRAAAAGPFDALRFSDTDRALEWCEDQLLQRFGTQVPDPSGSIELCRQYLCQGMSEAEIGALEQCGAELRYAAGDTVFRSGNTADAMYFILDGEVEVLVDTGSGQQMRLTTLGGGMVFGEVALVNRSRQRTADVVAAAATRCLRIPFEALGEAVRTRMLVNMASHFASKIDADTQLLRQLG